MFSGSCRSMLARIFFCASAAGPFGVAANAGAAAMTAAPAIRLRRLKSVMRYPQNCEAKQIISDMDEG